MRIGHAMAEGKLDWNEKALEVIYAAPFAAPVTWGANGTWIWKSNYPWNPSG